jgi:murein L,D-transpeptidase YcbB/YkuD
MTKLTGALTGAAAVTAVLTAGMSAAAAQVAVTAQGAPAGPAAMVAAAGLTRPAQALPAWPVLREGRNPLWPPVTVRSVQYLLDARGARLGTDGVFGPKTRAAVLVFQRAHRLPANGVVARATWLDLIMTVRPGSKGQAVRAVQDQINFRNGRNGHTLDVDGVFGAKTEAVVLAFQRAMATQVPGFAADGIVGPQTWQALVSGALSG